MTSILLSTPIYKDNHFDYLDDLDDLMTESFADDWPYGISMKRPVWVPECLAQYELK